MGWRGGAALLWFLLGALAGLALLTAAFPPQAL